MKTTKVLLIILAVLIVLPFAGRIIWALQKSKKMEIMIVNKTVPRNSHNEVKSLTWVLNYNKILKTDNTHYRYEKDYYGYHPDAPAEEWKIRSFRLADLPAIEEKYKVLVYLDNEGVPLREDSAEFPANHYGGFNQNDYLLLRQMWNANKLIIAEYDFFSGPTEELVRYNTEQMLDIHCLGWRGCFFRNLDAGKIIRNLDARWIDRYKEYYGKNWDFMGSGFVLINTRQNRIVVLPAKEFMDSNHPDVVTPDAYARPMNLPARAAFNGWFAIVYPGHNEVISTIDMNLNDAGREIMMKNGLECTCPAVIKSADHQFYYLAGDFSKDNVSLMWSRIRIVGNAVREIGSRMNEKPNAFFQSYYVPFMSAVLAENYEEMNEAGI